MDLEQLLGAPDVTAAVEALLVAVADAYAAAQARSGSPVSPRTPPERASLARLVTAERAVGLLAAEGLVAHESLVAAIADEVEVEHCSLGRPSARSRVLDDARVLAGDEIVAATGLGVHEVRRRSQVITAPPVVRERLLKRCARGPRRCSARPRWSTRCARAACRARSTPSPTRRRPGVPASVARDIAQGPWTVWHRLVHDPVTGVAMDRTASGYRIPQGLRDDVVARDVTCRAPGCAPTSLQADLAWPERAGRLEVTTPARPWPPPESPPY